MTDRTTISYQYTDRDLLQEPESYEYTEVHGRPFLSAYLDNRTEIIDAIEDRIERPDEIPTGFEATIERLAVSQPTAENSRGVGVAPVTPVPTPGDGSVETRQLLASLAGYDQPKPPSGEPANVWVDTFTKQYEVRKKLSASYDAEMNSVAENPASFDCYVLLAMVVLLAYERTNNLKYLNVALKLGDLLVSKHSETADSGTLALVRLVLREEVTAVRELADTKGVSL
jgi:hypothetical protein